MHVFTCESSHKPKQWKFFRTKISRYNTASVHTANAGNIPEQSETTATNSSLAKKPLPIRRRKIRRGWGGKNRNMITFSILASNANGLKGKFESLKNNINYFKPSCIIIQESKLKSKGTLKLNGYQIFELNRDGCGGGLFTAVDENLNPVLIKSWRRQHRNISYTDKFERPKRKNY